MESRRYGATPGEWESAVNSPLMPWVVPIVSNPNVPSSGASKAMKNERGKVPSEKNARGEAIGLRNWTHRAGNKDLDKWKDDPDYGFGVRLGRGGLVAVDCDCDDPTLSGAIREMLFSAVHAAPPLRRRGSARWACILRFKCRESVQKRRYTLPCGILEILGDGQQLACAGTHPSGARYEWEGGSVGDVVEVGFEDFTAFCDAVEAVYGGQSPVKPRVIGETYAAPDRLADWLRETGRVKSEGREGELYIECPWKDAHGEADGETSTVYFPVGSNGYDAGGFKCLHAHCAGHGMSDFLAACKSAGYTETDAGDYPDMTAGEGAGARPVAKTDVKTTAQALMAFRNEKSGKIDPCLQALEIALSDPSFCGYEIAFDTFAAYEMTRETGGEEWELFRDSVTTGLRVNLERLGFRTPKKQDVIDVVGRLAEKNKYDSMCEYLAANIPEWDGVPRVAGFFANYCGAEKSEWTVDVSLYLFTALWARASSPDGCKADIAPVLVGKQGTGKSTLARILALREEWCADADFSKKDDDLARESRRRLVMEIPELGGMNKREQNAVKAYITRTHDTWVPKFVEQARTAARRYVFLMTTNDKEFLTDPTGNRRWAPVEVGRIDRMAIKRDILQLWAEGRELFKQYGVMYEAVEHLQSEASAAFEAKDAWAVILEEWLRQNPCEPKTTRNIVERGLRLSYATFRNADGRRLSAVMAGLGYAKKRVMRDGARDYEWEPGNPTR